MITSPRPPLTLSSYLLPETGFEDRDWAGIPEDTHWRYEDFVKGVMPAGATISEGQSRKSKKVKILAQNGSAAATKLMSWLVSSATQV